MEKENNGCDIGTLLALNSHSTQNTSIFLTEKEYHITAELLKYKSQKQLRKSEVLKHLYYS